jgi:hypothetical protein
MTNVCRDFDGKQLLFMVRHKSKLNALQRKQFLGIILFGQRGQRKEKAFL